MPVPQNPDPSVRTTAVSWGRNALPSRQTHILGNGERHCQSSQNPKNGPSGVPGSPCRPVPWCLSSPLTLCSHRPPGIRPAHTGRLPRANHTAVPEQGLRWMGGGVCFPRPLKISGLPRVPPSSRACRMQAAQPAPHTHTTHTTMAQSLRGISSSRWAMVWGRCARV